MSKFQNTSIYEAVKLTKEKEYLLPVFQRSFVWGEEDIEKLFDSIMQNYPISAMLFWQLKVNKENFPKIKFYEFLSNIIEYHKIENSESCQPEGTFCAVLDGQQRLTAFRVGLTGSYSAHVKNKRWTNSKENFPEKRLYLLLSNSSGTSNIKYVFKFKTEKQTQGWKNLFISDTNEVWFCVRKIYECHIKQNAEDLFAFTEKNSNILSSDMRRKLNELDKALSETDTINYYLEDTTSPQTAVEIFNRINSGGKQLDQTDILFSILVANSKKDFREEFDSLLKETSEKGIPIKKSFVLKAVLFLFNKSVKTSIDSFTEEFCHKIEKNWEQIRKKIIELVTLLITYGFIENTLTSYNAILPVLYYLFHKNYNNDFSTAVCYEEDRKNIKQWLLVVLLRHAFGGASDNTLQAARQAFDPDFDSEIYITSSCLKFPYIEINNNISNEFDDLDEEFFDKIMNTQKDHKDCFLILSLLFKDLDYKNGNFHKDHMHPESAYSNLPSKLKDKYPFSSYNSIVNLQFLDANENQSKLKKPLKQWVEEELGKNRDKKIFYDNHYIPDVDLTLDNFDEFYSKRKKILINKLRAIMS